MKKNFFISLFLCFLVISCGTPTETKSDSSAHDVSVEDVYNYYKPLIEKDPSSFFELAAKVDFVKDAAFEYLLTKELNQNYTGSSIDVADDHDHSHEASTSSTIIYDTTKKTPYVLTNANMLDVRTGKMYQNVSILVSDGLIEEINPSSIPDSYEVVDMKGYTLLPGLTDTHVHIGSNAYTLNGLYLTKENTSLQTLRGVDNLRKTLLAGFTTIRTVGLLSLSKEVFDISLKTAEQNGWIDSPHIFASGHAISRTGGHIDLSMLGPSSEMMPPLDYRNGIADGIDEIYKAIRYQTKYGVDWVKISGTGGVMDQGIPTYEEYSPEELKALIDEAHREGRKTAIHAHFGKGIEDAIEAGIDSVEHGSDLSDSVIQRMVKNGTFLVPTDNGFFLDTSHDSAIVQCKSHMVAETGIDSHYRAYKAGVKTAFGTDVPIGIEHGENAKEFVYNVKVGMTPLQALQGATINAAELLGVEDRGELKKGYLADIIAIKGDPLKDISLLENVSFVMKDGKIYKNEIK